MTNAKSTMRYAAFALVSLLIGVGLMVLLLWKAETLVALGLTGNFYYIALLPLAASVSLLLFNVQRSYASYRGKQFGGLLEVSGPPVVFLLVLILGFYFTRPPPSNFFLTVYVHGDSGPQDLILRGNGYVVLDIGGNRRKASIGKDGDAFFSEIPASFMRKEVPIGLDADGYEPVDPNEKIRLNGGSAYLQVRRRSARLTGHVKNEVDGPLANVKVSVAGFATTTDVNGFFALEIPGETTQTDLILQAAAPGYEIWSDPVVPDSNEISVVLRRQR